MTNTLPTIDIKGKQYVLVKDRVLAFNELYPNGMIQTEIVSPIDSKEIIVRAIVTPDVQNSVRQFVDYSQATKGEGMINSTSALENASTSAVGRALAYMGIGVVESIASADEIVKAESNKTEVRFCSSHETPIEMVKGHSKSKNKDYWYHRNENDEICFGAGYQERQV